MNMKQEKGIEIIKDVVKAIFWGKVDRANAPYFLHIYRVADAVKTYDQKIVALLHDLIEDTDWQLDQLPDLGCTPTQIQAIDAITRRDCEPYEAFIQRVKANKIATKVKIADLLDNMNLERLPEITEADCKRNQKYLQALKELLN
jgi:guanosine-3',5'-bis(diphosphate) 3'-pyrophosphohydrolase